MFICGHGIDVESEREPSCFGPHPAALVSRPWVKLWFHTNIKLYLKSPGVSLLGLAVSPGLFTLQKHTCGKSIKRLTPSTVSEAKAVQ